MIETKVRYVDGVMFLESIKVLEPDGKYNGILIYRIDTTQFRPYLSQLKLLGLRPTGVYLPEYCAELWTNSYTNATMVKISFLGIKIYWWCLHFLYNNACVFRRIPSGEVFSWRYFTNYIWYRNLRKILTRKIKIRLPH